MKSIPIKIWRKFLKSQGLEKISTKSSHEKWDRKETPLLRPVTVDSNYKDVPITHIHTSLRAMGISKSEFEKLLKNI